VVAPASADTHTSRRAVNLPTETLDFTGLLGGVAKTGQAAVKNADGNTVGTAVQQCSNVLSGNAYCTGLITFSGSGSLAYAANIPTSATGSYTGVVAGGTDSLEGITGEIKGTITSHTVEELVFE